MKARKRQTYSDDKKKKILEDVRAYRSFGYSIEWSCNKMGISRSMYYRWTEQSLNPPQKPKSRRPKRFARETSNDVKNEIIKLAKTKRFSTANQITKAFTSENDSNLTTKTVIKILEEAALYGMIEVRNRAGKTIKKSGLIFQK